MNADQLHRIAELLHTAADAKAKAESHERLSGGFHVEQAQKLSERARALTESARQLLTQES